MLTSVIWNVAEKGMLGDTTDYYSWGAYVLCHQRSNPCSPSPSYSLLNERTNTVEKLSASWSTHCNVQAWLNSGSSRASIAASLLHDVGHLLHDLGDDASERGVDDRHEYGAISYLQQWFGDNVTEPIRLHVEAKRCLCALDEKYWDVLSVASQYSLMFQGGIFTAAEADAFMQQPYVREEIALRRWDDAAKCVQRATPHLENFLEIAMTCMRY